MERVVIKGYVTVLFLGSTNWRTQIFQLAPDARMVSPASISIIGGILLQCGLPYRLKYNEILITSLKSGFWCFRKDLIMRAHSMNLTNCNVAGLQKK
jgi:hypothetical protein